MTRPPLAARKTLTVPHFEAWARKLTLDSGKPWNLEPFQRQIAADVFDPAIRELWVIVGEGNTKSTTLAGLALYVSQHSLVPWVPVGAASRDQAEILFGQAAGFVERSPYLRQHFRVYGGYRRIVATRQGGRGIRVYPFDVRTGDGVIPFPVALLDELHRHPDLTLYRTWRGKLAKRGAKLVVISTAGEPGSEFEEARDLIRRSAPERQRDGAHLRAVGGGLVLHEWRVEDEDAVSDIAAVKAANPFSGITEQTLREEFESPTLDLNHWRRMKAGIAARGLQQAITDAEWDGAQVDETIPEGARIVVGADLAWKWDCSALVPLYEPGGGRLLVGKPTILTPPRDGNSLHPDELKAAISAMHERYAITDVVMDLSNAEDVAHWIVDELGVDVHDRGQSNKFAVLDYAATMKALRGGHLRHTGDPELRRHVLNAIARRLPGGDLRFERPSSSRHPAGQDQRVIDGLTALAMAVEHVGNRPAKVELLGWL